MSPLASKSLPSVSGGKKRCRSDLSAFFITIRQKRTRARLRNADVCGTLEFAPVRLWAVAGIKTVGIAAGRVGEEL